MNSISTFIQRIAAALSFGASVAAVPALVPAFASPASAGANPASGNHTSGHMTTGWLGGFAEVGCAKNAYGTKRITTGSLDEVST